MSKKKTKQIENPADAMTRRDILVSPEFQTEIRKAFRDYESVVTKRENELESGYRLRRGAFDALKDSGLWGDGVKFAEELSRVYTGVSSLPKRERDFVLYIGDRAVTATYLHFRKQYEATREVGSGDDQ